MSDDKPTLVLFAVGDGFEASFEEGKPTYRQDDLADVGARYYVIIIERCNDAAPV